MSKNILIFSDGTGQQGGIRPDQNMTNIYKLYRACRTGIDSPINPKEQIAFYDPGLGTEPDGGRINIKPIQYVRKFINAAFGSGISRNITDCYESILKNYEPGDRIFLFGFSRGAYTVRCVAEVLRLCGIPTQTESAAFCPKYGKVVRKIAEEAVYKVHDHGAGRKRSEFSKEREELARRFRKKYGSEANGVSNVVPYALGVFDTVAALGASGFLKVFMVVGTVIFGLVAVGISVWIMGLLGLSLGLSLGLVSIFSLIAIGYKVKSQLKVIDDFPHQGNSNWHIAGWKASFYDEHFDRRINFGRHAIAIDETRTNFERVRWGAKKDSVDESSSQPLSFVQKWFSGNHSDVGGGYAEEESRLSDIALGWMADEMVSLPHPLIIDKGKLHLFPCSNGIQHSEVECFRDKYPLWVPAKWRLSWKESPRAIDNDAPFHASVLERFKLKSIVNHGNIVSYRPLNLKKCNDFTEYYKNIGD